MTYLIRTALLFLPFLFLGSCFGPPVNNAPVVVERTDNDYETKKAKDEDRDTVIKRTSRTISGDTEQCEDKDKKHKCYEYCDDMFRSNSDEDDCEELTVAQIEAIWELYELLEDPDADDLGDINSEVFDLYVNISIKSLDDLIGDYSRSDAEEFLIWLIKNAEIAKIFRKEDDEHKSLEALLKSFSGSYTSSDQGISTPFLKKLDSDKLIEEALGSELILEWFQDYIDEKNTACKSDAETRACFAVYCKIGEGMDDDLRDDWLDSDKFEGYIEDIIDEKVNSRQGTGSNRNATGWIHEDAAGSDNDEIGDLGDLDDDWVDELCQGLTDGAAGSSGSGSSGNQQGYDSTWPTLCNTTAERASEAACSTALKKALKVTGEGKPTSDQSADAFLWIIQKDTRVTAVFLKANGDLDLTSAGAFIPFLKAIGGNVPGTPTVATTKAFFNIELARNKPNETLAEIIINDGSNKAFQLLFEDYIFDTSQHTCSGTSNSFGDNEACFKNLICGMAKQFNSKQKTAGKWLERTYRDRLNDLLKRVRTFDTRPGYVKNNLKKSTKIDKKWITKFCP